jgi:amidophosphoribosyltransferase
MGSCYYGVDTPCEEELISNRMDIAGVCMSLSKLHDLLGEEAPTFCDACFSKEYPVPPRKYEELHLSAMEI